MKKLVFIFFFSAFTLTSTAQIRNSWNIGAGFAITNFNSSDALYIGDKTLFQTPRLNITAPITEEISLDLAYAFNTIKKIGIIENLAKYNSFDISARYNFNEIITNLNPYGFVGGSIVSSERKTTPTLNAGVGATYWISDKLGLNTQFYYKHSFENFESMRSHKHFTFSLLYNLGGEPLFDFRRSSSYKCK